MADPNRIDAQQVVDIVRLFLRLEGAMKVSLPDRLASLKAHLQELHPEGGPKRASDYELFFRIGLVLQSQTDPPSMGKLSQQLAVPLSTATRLVDWMVDGGYAERLADPDDRRVVRVCLTPAGRELYEAISAHLQERVEASFGVLTDRERSDLLELMRKLVRALEQTDSQ